MRNGVMDGVSVKFGRDIASIVHLWVWKLGMKRVNTVFMDKVKWDYRHRDYFFFNGVAIANRVLLAPGGRCFIYSFLKCVGRVCELPKNYFRIKELY